MAKQSVECSLFSVILITFMLTTASILAGPAVLAVKKGSSSSSSTSSVKTVHKTSSKSTTTTKAQHIKGVKVSRVHTVPSKVAVAAHWVYVVLCLTILRQQSHLLMEHALHLYLLRLIKMS